jgi:hypothetical protein
MYINPETATLQVMVSPSLKESLVLALEDDVDDPSYLDSIATNCARAADECVFIMARDQFHRFILSKFYKSWRSAESSHARATTTAETEGPVIAL